MRPLRYSSNVTLDGCCDHRAMVADEDLHRHAVENLTPRDSVPWLDRAWRLERLDEAPVAYPLDADVTPSASSTGYASTFARAGFRTAARRVPARPAMRHGLEAM